MSREVSGAGSPATPVTHTEHLNSEPFVQEFLHLVDDGWEPDLEEFLDRVPEPVRNEVFERLDEALEQRTVKTWDESDEFAVDDVLRQSLGADTPEEILAAATDEFDEPSGADHVAAAKQQAPAIIPIADPHAWTGERFVPESASAASEPEPEPEPEPEEIVAAEEPEELDEPEMHEEWGPRHSASSFSFVAGMDLRRDLGRGSLGESFLGVNASGTPKVLTVASAELPSKVLQRLSREAAKVKALCVDQLVTIEETRREERGDVVIAPFVEGEPIDLAVVDLDLDDRARYLQIVVEALATAHAAGLVHLDLKPSNVLVTPDGDIRLLDFGVGAAVTSVPERLAKLAGLGHFASPEHPSRRRLGAASDIFSFGSLMYRVLTRKLPFPGGAPNLVRNRIDAAEPRSPRLQDDRIPVELQDICLSCLARNASDRPDAVTLIANFDRYFVGRPVRVRPTLYRDLLRRETREVVARATEWRKQGLARSRQTDRIEAVCRRIVACEERWTYDSAHAPRMRALVMAGTMFFALSASLLVRFGYAHVSMFAAAFPVVGVGALLLAGVRALRRGEPALADSLIGGALVALVPAVLTVLQRTALLGGAGPGVGFSWLQLAAAAGTVGILAAALLYRRKRAVYSWIVCGAFVLAWIAAVGANGFFGYGAIVFAPLALLLVFARQFEAHDRFGSMQPFFLTGLFALTVIPLYAAFSGAYASLPGIEVALVGVLWLAFAALLARGGGLALREAARWMSALAPGLLIAGLAWHATEAAEATAWLGVAGVAALLTMQGAALQRPAALAWGLAGLSCAALLPVLGGLVTPWTFAVLIGAAGLGAALVTALARSVSE